MSKKGSNCTFENEEWIRLETIIFSQFTVSILTCALENVSSTLRWRIIERQKYVFHSKSMQNKQTDFRLSWNPCLNSNFSESIQMR